MKTFPHYRPAQTWPRIDDGCLSSAEVCQAADITYRQLDHWIRNGIVIVPAVTDPGQGRGRTRRFTKDQAKRIAAVAAEKRDLDERCIAWSTGLFWNGTKR